MSTRMTSSEQAEFSYEMQLVIYKFIELVPSSVQSTPSEDEIPMCCSMDNVTKVNDQMMFTELKNAVAARHRQKEEAARTLLLSKKVFKELKTKVVEQDQAHRDTGHGDGTMPSMTIIRKKNAVKAVMSQPVILLSAHSTSVGQDFDNSPLVTSTPIVLNSSHLGSSLQSQQLMDSIDSLESTELLSRSVSSVSDASSAYVDISQIDDIKPLVSAGVLPSVVEPLLEEVQRGISELKTSHLSDHESAVEDDFDGDHFFDLATVLHDPADMLASYCIKQAQIAEAADLLRCVGDQIQAEFGDQIDNIVGRIDWSLPRPQLFAEVRRLSEDLMHRVNNGWIRVALAMLLCGRMVFSMLSGGFKGVNDVVKFTAQIIEDSAAQYIIEHGGWSSISELGETTVCMSEESLMCDMEPTSSSGDKEDKFSAANNNEADEIDGSALIKKDDSLRLAGPASAKSVVESGEGRCESGQQFQWFDTFSAPRIIVAALVVTAGFIILRQLRQS